jgi:hypothetical protein
LLFLRGRIAQLNSSGYLGWRRQNHGAFAVVG